MIAIPSGNSERYAELDGVRGVAIALTLLCNTLMLGWGGNHAQKAWHLLAEGSWIGVQLFFVLSGFLITGILIDSKGGKFYFRNFYARRALRIFPAYFLMVAIVFIGLSISNQHMPLSQSCYWFFVSNFCIANYGSWVDDHLGITWSLAVEEQFYLVWPFLIWLLPVRYLGKAIAAIIAASLLLRYGMVAAGVSGLKLYALTPVRADGLAAGALIAVAVRSGIGGERLAKLGITALAGGIAAMVAVTIEAGSFDYRNTFIMTIGYTALTVASSGLVLFLAAEQNAAHALRRTFRWKPLVAFGFYSYGIYLYHALVSFFFGRFPFLQPEALARFPGGPFAAQIMATASITAITFLLALVSYHLFEKRFLDLRPYFPAKGKPARPASAPYISA